MGQRPDRFFYIVHCYGAESVAAAIYEHGAPRRVFALRSFLRIRREGKLWQSYSANMLWTVAKLLNPQIKVSAYTDIIKPQKKEPEMTGDAVLEHIKNELQKRIERG